MQRTNDLYFVWCALNLAERIVCLDRVLVHYRVGDTGSLQANNRKSPTNFCYAKSAVKRRLQEEGCFTLAENGFICEAMRTCEYNLRSLKKSDEDAYRY